MRKLLPMLAALALLIGSFSPAPAAPAGWQSKVDPWVLQTAESGETEFIVFLSNQADLSAAAALETKIEKGAYVYKTLTETAARTQGPLLAALEAMGVEYQSYWVANMVWVRGGAGVVEALAQRSDVYHIYANPQVRLSQPPLSPTFDDTSPEAIEWNVLKVNADDLWALGYNGQGVVIGGQDTGYQWDHPALKDHYRGWTGVFASHDYNWHDSIHAGSGGSCGLNSPFPCDDYGHGTHTMGTMAGDDGGSNQIGVAPGAQWIGCRNMDVGNGTPTTYSECYQWFIAPTPVSGGAGNPALAPDVINNSWGCPASEGCTDPNVLLTVTENVRAAGILTVHSAGNSGSSCSTVSTPSAIYAASFTVGATDSGDNIGSFSSRGPVTVDGSNRLKPNISAPGVNIRSSIPGGGYQGGWDGTSMAGPHVAGVAALLISADPSLAGQVDTLETLMELTALPRTTTQNCGGVPGSNIPNNTYGYGRVDALAAYNALTSAHSLTLDKTASPAMVEPGGLITYTISVAHQHLLLPTHHISLSDQLPAGTTFFTATLPHTFDGSTVAWQNPLMDAGETWEVQFVVQTALTATGLIVNETYSVESDEAALVTGDPVTTSVLAPTLELAKAAPARVAPGGVITYSLTVTNPLLSLAQHNLVLSDTLPAGTTLVGASAPYTLTGEVVSWALPSLAIESSWTVTLAVQSPVTFTGTIYNQDFGVRSDEFGPLAGAPVRTDIFALAVSKIASAGEVAPGGLLTYTLSVANLHPAEAATGVVISDALPVHTVFVAASGDYTVTNGTVVWDLPSLEASGEISLTLVVSVSLTAGDEVVNDNYRAVSVEAPTPVSGAPVITGVRWYRVYLPVVSH